MAGITHKTKGIVLRTVKYGETSVICSVFTELFGLQSYIVNGVRTGKKSGNRAVMYQPGALLELVAYHQEQKQLQRIKEAQWSYLYRNIYQDVPKHAVTTYLIELLSKLIRQPDPDEALFAFAEDCLLNLDSASPQVTANFPLFAALQLPYFFGFRISNAEAARQAIYLDLQEGMFVAEMPTHPHFLHPDLADVVRRLLMVMQPSELNEVPLNRDIRRQLLIAFESYYALHLPDFSGMRTLPILRSVLG